MLTRSFSSIQITSRVRPQKGEVACNESSLHRVCHRLNASDIAGDSRLGANPTSAGRATAFARSECPIARWAHGHGQGNAEVKRRSTQALGARREANSDERQRA